MGRVARQDGTAKALGLAIPQELMLRADWVTE